MVTSRANKWALKNFRKLTEYTALSIFDEIEANISGTGKAHILNNPDDAYALASRFKNVLFRYPFFKKKHHRILRAIIDRCGEAYHKKDLSRLYISKEVVEQWSYAFRIPPEKMMDYLYPLLQFHILERSDVKKYVFKVTNSFFQLTGPTARYLIMPVDTRKFSEMMSVTSGISSIYVIATAIKSKRFIERKTLIPWFLKLSMIYTLSGLEPRKNTIRDILEISRINDVDEYFVIEKRFPVELWRSIRVEAFEFMGDNAIIEQAIPDGYRLNRLWVRMHEEGVRRYIRLILRRYDRKFRRY